MATPASDPMNSGDGPPPEVAARAASGDPQGGKALAGPIGQDDDEPTGRGALPPVVELAGGKVKLALSAVLGALAFVGAALVLPVSGSLLPAVLAAGAVAGAAFWIDLRHRVIPNRINVIGMVAVPVLCAIADLAGAQGSIIGGIAGGFGAFVLYLVLAIVAPAGMGMGDVKLAPTLFSLLGFLGYGPWRNALLLGFILQALVSLGLLVGKRIGRKGKVAHGPAMVIGALVALLIG